MNLRMNLQVGQGTGVLGGWEPFEIRPFAHLPCMTGSEQRGRSRGVVRDTEALGSLQRCHCSFNVLTRQTTPFIITPSQTHAR